MKLYLNKKKSVDYSNPIKPPKTDRPASRPYFVATEANEASYYLDPNSIFPGKALPGHLAPKKRTKSRPSVILNQSQNKSLAKISYYIKTENSVVNHQDVSCDDIMMKFGKMKIELKQSKEKEKLYLTKINNLEKEKEILISRLGKYKQKYVQISQENSIDKRRLSFPIESLKVAGGEELNKSKEIREIKNVLILDKSINAVHPNEVVPKAKFSEMLNTLNNRVLEIESYANSLYEENTKVKKEMEHYKRINEELKSSLEQSKLQTRDHEDFQVELIDQYKQANADCQHLRSYLKEFVSFRTNKTNEHITGRKLKQQQSILTSCKKSLPQPIPSYIKALSLSLCTEVE